MKPFYLYVLVALVAIAGGLAAALTVAIPLVDDGLAPSEALSIALAFLTGTGLTAAPVTRLSVR